MEMWINKKYHILEERDFITSMYTRPIAAALVYIGGIVYGEEVSKNTILQIMEPLAENTLNEKIKYLKRCLVL